MTAILNKTPEQHIWTLHGHHMTQLCIDRASCRLQSWLQDASLEIRFGVPFELTFIDGITRILDPEEPEQLAPLLTLLGREIQQLTIARTGSLSVRMSDGSLLTVESHPSYEAFEINGTGVLADIGYLASPGDGSPWGR